MTRGRATAGAAMLVAIGVIVAVILATRSDGQPEAASTVPTASSTTTLEEQPIHALFPIRTPGVKLSPFTVHSDGVSLMFRLRNTILNGLPGSGSDYRVETAIATVGGVDGRLVGIGAAPNAPVANMGARIRRLVGVAPESSEVRTGHRLSVHVLPTYVLCVVDAGPRRALVTLAPDRTSSLRIAHSVADALST